MTTRREDIRHWAMWAGKLLLAVLLLTLLLAQLDADSLAQLTSAAQPHWLLAALLLLLPNIYFQFRKWQLLLRSVYPAVESRQVRDSLFLGFSFGVVTPARIGEFGGRAAGVRGADRLTLVGLTAVDKVATLTVTLGAGALGLLLFCFRHPFMSPWLLLAVEVACAAIILTFVYLRRRKAGARTALAADDLAKRDAGGGKGLVAHVRRLRTALGSLDSGTRRGLLLFSVLFYLTFVLQFFFLLRAFGPIDPLTTLAGISSIMLIKTLVPPLTLGELGIREGVSVLVLGWAGTVTAVALGASLLLFAINVLLPGLVGLAVLLRRPRRETA
jgi:uncharacterized protein (TIRG00374 family)